LTFKNILFIGLGGAGQRHLRVFQKLLPSDVNYSAFRHSKKTPLLNPDFTVRNSSIEDIYGVRMFDTVEEAFANKPDLTVISTPTSFHYPFMMLAVAAGSAIFVEKPWDESLVNFHTFQREVLSKRIPFHISFQRRFHPQIQESHSLISSGAIGRPVAASFTVYSNVPSWHPYEDWRELYAVRPEMGGGVLLTEIHELDLAIWFLGLPKGVFCCGGNFGKELLEVEDTAQITFIYDNFTAQITLCFMHGKPSRSFHIAGTLGDLKWSGDEYQLSFTNFESCPEEKSVDVVTNDQLFISQAKKFLFEWSTSNTRDSLASAKNSLAVVEAAKRSMQSKAIEWLADV